jgi:hypothetical protein
MTISEKIEFIKIEIRENQSPYFEVEEIEHYLIKNKGNINNTIYELLIVKSEDSSIQVNGLNTGDTSKYFMRLASNFRPSASRVLGG